ncbi:carbohydrate ABC transporter permease [Cohnella suwonensis]|uniref:Carbohydrate ABC transporter permease n=1 Tax=Cohnella suwonensis TaxID=696072 RepID=A0ABW0LT44_9BACL
MTASKNRIIHIILQVALIAFAIVQFYPLVWLGLTSFKSNMEITGSNIIGLPAKWLWSNYDYSIFKMHIGRNFANSLFYTLATVIASTVLSAMVSFAIVRMKWKFSKPVLTYFMLGMMIPVHATLLPVFLLLKQTSLLDSPWALIIPYTVNALPGTIFILVGFFSAIPRELEESSIVDGCNIYQVFYSIMLPLIKPAIVTTAIFTFLSAWNELMFAVTFINDPKLSTITVAINSLQGIYSSPHGAIAAGMVVATLPTIVVYLLMSKHVQKGLLAGAVKG